jgi:hypothetical protein
MGLWRIARDMIAGPQQTPPSTTAGPAIRRPATTPAALASELHAEYPEGIDTAVLWERCEAAGIPMSEVDNALDQLRFDAEQKAQRRVAKIDPDRLRVLDLSRLDSVRMRITGSSYAVSDRERARYGGTDYLLVREPDNASDASAVAVYGNGRRVGYVAASRAGTIAPLLDQLDADAFRVGGAGAGEQGSRLWVDLPRADALRAFLRGRK